MTTSSPDNPDNDISQGRGADSHNSVADVFDVDIRKKFEIFSYRSAAYILKHSFPIHYNNLCNALRDFSIDTKMIRMPGGNKSSIAFYVDSLFSSSDGWREAQITADLNVKVYHPKRKDEIYEEYERRGFLDGHRIDFLNGRVAMDFEWNSKDQTYDRDLYAFSAFYQAGAIDVGILLTRGASLDNEFFRSLGNVLTKEGGEGNSPVASKYGASTTWMGKLLYRLDAGRNGGCPVLAVGITPECVSDYHTIEK